MSPVPFFNLRQVTSVDALPDSRPITPVRPVQTPALAPVKPVTPVATQRSSLAPMRLPNPLVSALPAAGVDNTLFGDSSHLYAQLPPRRTAKAPLAQPVQSRAEVEQVLNRGEQIKAPKLSTPIPGPANLSDSERLARLSQAQRIQYVLDVAKSAVPSALGQRMSELAKPENGFIATAFVAAQWIPVVNAAVDSVAVALATKSALDTIGGGVGAIKKATDSRSSPGDLFDAGQDLAKSAAGAVVETIKTVIGISVAKRYGNFKELAEPATQNDNLVTPSAGNSSKIVRGSNFDVYSTAQFRALAKQDPGIFEVLKQLTKNQGGLLKGVPARNVSTLVGTKNSFTVLPAYNKGVPLQADIEYIGSGTQSHAFKVSVTQRGETGSQPSAPTEPFVVKVNYWFRPPPYSSAVQAAELLKGNSKVADQMRAKNIRFADTYFLVSSNNPKEELPKGFNTQLYVGEFIDPKNVEAVLIGREKFDAARQIVTKLNQERAEAGKPIVAKDRRLDQFKISADKVLDQQDSNSVLGGLELDTLGANSARLKGKKQIVIYDPFKEKE
jgi:hypothetical protein